MRQISLIMLLMLSVSLVFSQNVKRINGKILFEDNKPAVGVSVILEASPNFTYTDMKNGSFRLNLNSDNGTILVFHKDYGITRIPVTIDSNNMLIVLKKITVSNDAVIAETASGEIQELETKEPEILNEKNNIASSSEKGILKGKVMDENGTGLRGASVFIEGTQKGAAVRENDGSYLITGISAGEYTVRFVFTGKSTLRQEIRISSGEITYQEVVLKDETVKTQEIMVIAQQEIVHHDKIGSMDKRTNVDIQNTAREGVSGAISLSSGYSVRGGRDSQTDIRIDGMSVSNSFTGNSGVIDKDASVYYPMVSSYAATDVSSINGGSNAPNSGDLTGFYPDLSKYAGQLTAGEVNDFSKWVMWNDIAADDLSEYKDIWKLYPKERYTLQLENEFHLPVFGAKISLLENEFVIWSSFTDNTGKAELWRNPFTERMMKEGQLFIEIEYSGKNYYIQSPKQFSDGINFFSIQTGSLKPQSVDIAFVVDGTNSMRDEIDYLKSDILSVINQIKDTLPDITINLGSVFYWDTLSVKYVYQYSNLNADFNVTSQFINKQVANSDGNYTVPEAVNRGLDVAINHFNWREDAMTKIIFLVLDAPPFSQPEIIAEMQALMLKASEKGIRIIPVACSGIDKSTEYLLRSLAILTNGTYTFLTDDSGIGNPHIKPSTDKYEVETLRDIIIRLVYQYSYYPEIVSEEVSLKNDSLNNVISEKISLNDYTENKDIDLESIKFYPNPTYGEINIEIEGSADELFISDISGKIVYRINPSGQDKLSVNMSEYPSGMYFIMYQYAADKWMKGKFVLMH